jgi:glyoxylase-like metal-dependent hydrolase (beta-lactamase superfamily II)
MKWKLLLAACALAGGIVGCSVLTGNVSQFQAETLTVRTFTVPFNNSHLLMQGDRGVLIDAGSEEGAEHLDKLIRESGFDPKNLAAIVITHGHHDHAGGARHFRETYDTPIIAGSGDVPLLKAGRNDTLCPTTAFARLRYNRDQAGRYTGYEPDVAVRNVLNLKSRYGIDAVAFLLPGHTEGSLVITAGQFAFIGDLFRGSTPPGQALTHLYMCDLHDNKRDIATVLNALAPKAERFFTGHFGSVDRAAVQDLLNER